MSAASSGLGPERPPHPGRGVLARAAVAGVVVVFLVAATTATAVLLEVADIGSALKAGGPSLRLGPDIVDQVRANGPQTILVIGSDRRWKDRRDPRNARSDTILLLRLNPDAASTTVFSIPRDLKTRLRRGGPFDKINAAYSKGGPAMTARVVKRILSFARRPFEINHVVNVNFRGFKAVVDRLGCVYTDVDRFYFNDNNPPAGGGEPYATIDIKPGYQKLCGRRALDYVRFRHLDTDIVRAARQQDFLRQAKAQYGVSRIVGDRQALARIMGRYTQTDRALRRTPELIKLLDLGLLSAGKPVQEVHFPAILGDATDPYVTVSRRALRRAVRRFLEGEAAAAPRSARRLKRERRAARRAGSAGLVNASVAGEQQATLVAARVRFPVYYPRLLTAAGTYMGPYDNIHPRAYRFRALGRWRGNYRMVIDAGGIGEFYGVQGTTWKNPPLLRDPSGVRRVAGRRLELFFDGRKLRVVAWRTPRAVYWISNTLLETLTNRQMLRIAASLTRVGSVR